jgi:hypothetical protein
LTVKLKNIMFWLLPCFTFDSPGLSGKFDYLQGGEFNGFIAILRDQGSGTNYSFHNLPWFQVAEENVIRKDSLDITGIPVWISTKTRGMI